MIQSKRDRIYIKKGSSKKPDTMAKMHAHEEHEIYFLVSGQRRYFIGHTIFDIFPGNLVIIPKTEFHRTTSPGKLGWERYVLSFRDQDFYALSEIVGKPAISSLLTVSCLQFPADIAKKVQEDLEKMEKEQNEPSEFSQAYLSHLLQDILLLCLRYGKKRSPCSGGTADKIQEVARYISENYHSPLSLSDAAHMAYMENTYFSKCFKSMTGFGFQEYLTETRIRAARALLIETDLPVGEIAERCGFSGSNYFGDAFRKWTGKSPLSFRQERNRQQKKSP